MLKITLNDLKKQFEEIAVRYCSKEYLKASAKNTIGFSVYVSVNNGGRDVSAFSFNNGKRIYDGYKSITNYEFKALFMNLSEYIIDNSFDEVEFTYCNGKLGIEHYKLKPVPVEE